jgi:pyruvate formate lyase activating enzyme
MTVMQKWRESWTPARLGEPLEDGSVRCHLSPRKCVIKEGRNGFCGVRGNRNGQLVTMNYGKSVHLTEETIETEAVNHFAPGERILSLGNLGCMMNCVYCHNWKTSQAKYADDRDVHSYTPEQIIETAKRHGIRVLSWTYNDPVVWHEFVLETSRLAKKEGITTLYKSAFFIGPEAVEELIPVIDIFSISLKSIDHEYYRRYTTGELQPVLDATKMVHKAGKHLEVSTLMITDISDDEDSARKIAQWVLDDLDANVPLHYVRFHPDYKMRNTVRTPISRLIRAREIALGMGVKHVYLGNVYDTPHTNSTCRNCGTLLVDRYGLRSQSIGLNDEGSCTKCGAPANTVMMPAPEKPRQKVAHFSGNPAKLEKHMWGGDIQSIHVQAQNTADQPRNVYHRTILSGGGETDWTVIPFLPGESFRFIIARSGIDDIGAEVAISEGVELKHAEVFDRAHFPTLSVEDIGAAENDVTPFPHFEGNQFPTKAKVKEVQ